MYGVIKKMTNSGVKTPLVQSHDMKSTKMKKNKCNRNSVAT